MAFLKLLMILSLAMLTSAVTFREIITGKLEDLSMRIESLETLFARNEDTMEQEMAARKELETKINDQQEDINKTITNLQQTVEAICKVNHGCIKWSSEWSSWGECFGECSNKKETRTRNCSISYDFCSTGDLVSEERDCPTTYPCCHEATRMEGKYCMGLFLWPGGNLTPEHAKDHCMQIGLHQIMVTSTEKEAAVLQYARHWGKPMSWNDDEGAKNIAIDGRFANGTWRYHNGEHMFYNKVGYRHEDTDEEGCLRLLLDTGKWESLPCSTTVSKLFFMCEAEMDYGP